MKIVVKVGTSTLTHVTGCVNIRRIEKLVKVLSDIKNAGNQVILVSSGAIAMGVGKLNLEKRPVDIAGKQAAAAVGQCELMDMYDKRFSEYGVTVAQLLLTKYVLIEDRRRNVENAMARLLELGVIPIVNENDTVAIDELELEVGENDSLAAIVASVAKADMLVIMSDIDGLYDKDPHKHSDAQLISEVFEVTDEIRSRAGGAGSSLGTGGMATKIRAAAIAKENGIDMVIMNGNNPEALYDICEGKSVGTRFYA